MSVTLKIALSALVALLLGLAVGFYAGRTSLERSWSEPYAAVTDADAARFASDDADPAPKAGSKVLKPMPLGRARAVLTTASTAEPIRSTVATFGSGDDGIELVAVFENRGKCTITSASGIAYGWDARGKVAAANKHGEHFVAFKLDTPIEPGKTATLTQKLRYADAATLALAQVDSTQCADGTAWKRQ